MPSLGAFRLPRWLAVHRGAVVRREPAPVTRLVPAMDEPPPVVPRTTRLAALPRRPRQESLPLSEVGWRFPPLSLLKPAPARATSGPSEEALQANARLLETVLVGLRGAGQHRGDPSRAGGDAV